MKKMYWADFLCEQKSLNCYEPSGANRTMASPNGIISCQVESGWQGKDTGKRNVGRCLVGGLIPFEAQKHFNRQSAEYRNSDINI